MRITRLLALMVAASLAVPAAARAAESSEIQWQPDFQTALQVAKKEHKDVLVDFYTTWCKWCKVQDDSTLAVPSMVEFSRNYVWVKVDAEHGADTVVAHKYNIRGYPTVVMINSSGDEYDRIVGYNHAPEFRQQVEDYRAGRNTLKALLAEAPAHPRDWALQLKLAEKLYGNDRLDEAVAHYRSVFEGDSSNTGGRAEEAGYMVARTVRRANKYDDALAVYQALLSRFPKGELRPGTRYGLALTYKGMGNKAAAIAAFEQYLREFPRDDNVVDAQKEIDDLKNPPHNP